MVELRYKCKRMRRKEKILVCEEDKKGMVED